MAADVASSLKSWSALESGNQPSGAVNVGPNLDDNLRMIQAVSRTELATRGTIAAATTTDLNTVDAGAIDITGSSVSISSLGTVSAGIRKRTRTTGSVTFVHSASLDCLGAANITTQAGDLQEWESTGSGWFMTSYTRDAAMPSLAVSGYLKNTSGVLSWAAAAVALNSITAATGTGSLSNALGFITWDWSGSYLGGQSAFNITGTDSGLSGNSILMKVSGDLNHLLQIAPSNTTGSFRFGKSGAVFLSPGALTGAGNAGKISINGANAFSGANGTGGDLDISSGIGDGTGASGNIVIAAANHGTGSGAAGSVQISSGTTSGAGSNGTITLSTGRIRINLGSTNPTVSAGGGAGASVVGADNAFTVTFGTGSPTSVVIGFAASKPVTPIAVCTGEQSGQVLTCTPSTTGVTIASSTAFSSGTKVHCFVVDRVV